MKGDNATQLIFPLHFHTNTESKDGFSIILNIFKAERLSKNMAVKD